MLSAAHIITQDWDHHDDDDHHHHHRVCYDSHTDPDHHHDHVHVHEQHHHHQDDDVQVGTGLDEKTGESSSNESHILKIIRKKRQVEVGLCGDDQRGSKICLDCHTSKTPLWRSGPAGPKSLCNACGIRYRKRRRNGFDFLGLQKQARVMLKKFAGKEEAEAAVLLMALSCGVSVHS